MSADKTAAPEWIDVAFADGFGWSTYAAHDGDKTRFIRSDLCASGQQVRALPRAVGDDLKAGWTLSFEDLQDIRDAAGDWGYTLYLKAVENIALEVERRILAALTPAPQAEGQDALKISPEYQALFDEVKQRAQPEEDFPQPSRKDGGEPCGECRLPAGETCDICGAVSRVPAPSAATPTAQEAVPVAWQIVEVLETGAIRSEFFENRQQTIARAAEHGAGVRPLFAHPPQPSETVAVLEEARSGLCAFAGGPSGACSETIKRINAALRALKGGA